MCRSSRKLMNVFTQVWDESRWIKFFKKIIEKILDIGGFRQEMLDAA